MSQNSKIFVCDQHSSNISRKLQTFYRDQLFFDIALIAKSDNVKVHAHRTVLSASSDHFLVMLCSTLKEARSDVIELGIDGPTLQAIVDFMYTGTIELRWENVARTLAAAYVLKMTTLKVACSEFIGETINDTNWLCIASMAKEQQSAELHETAFTFALQNFEELSQKDEFLQLTEQQLGELITSDDLCVNSEETVFHSVVHWVKYEKGLREESLTRLLEHVRFSCLTPEFIVDNRHSLSKTYECLELLFRGLESHLSSTKMTKRHPERRKAIAVEIETEIVAEIAAEIAAETRVERETLGFVSEKNTDKLKMHSFDPESNTWTCENLPPAPLKGRYDFRAIAVDNKIIVAGGMLGRSHVTNTVECLDLKTKKWTNLPPMKHARRLPALAALNGDLYVVGGKSADSWSTSVEKYDFRTREWHELAPMHSEPKSYSRVTVLGELLYAVGESDSPIEFYNPAFNRWAQLPHKNERSKLYGIAGVGGYLYAVGGWHEGRTSKTVERFNPSTSTWSVISPGLGLGLRNLNCVSWNERLIACCGYDSQCKEEKSVVEYDPERNEWRTLPSLVEGVLEVGSCNLLTFTK